MFIEIKGVQFVNKGAELMLYAIVQKLRESVPDVKIVLPTRRLSPYESRIKIGGYQKIDLNLRGFDLNAITYWLPVRLRNYLRRSLGIVFEVDVDVILDGSGFSYGDQWPAWLSGYMCRQIDRLNKKGRHYVLMPQALGPFSRPGEVRRIKKSIGKASFVFARDSVSYASLIDACGSLRNFRLSPDFTNLLDVSGVPNPLEKEDYAVIIPNGKMLDSKNPRAALWSSNYLNVLDRFAGLCERNNLKVYVLNHEGAGDAKIIDALLKKSECNLIPIAKDDAMAVKCIIRDARIVLSSRFHGCVSALSQGVPCVATSWSHKYTELFSDYQVKELVLETPDLFTDEIYERAMASTLLLKRAAPIEKKKASDMWVEIFSVL